MTYDPEIFNRTALANLELELSKIGDLDLRQFTSEMILHAPGEYWYRPAGNHAGHHPDDEHGAWGNLIHVKRAFLAARPLLEAEDCDTEDCDSVYSAILLHDIGKYGMYGEMVETDPDHVLSSVGVIELHHEELKPPLEDLFDRVVTSEVFYVMKMAILCHAGRWGKFPPVTLTARIVHYADMVASRIALPVEIDVPY